MAGLNQDQLDILKGMPGIDQKLVSAYEKGGANLSKDELSYVESKVVTPSVVSQTQTGAKVTPTADFNPDEATSRITNFSAALNTAIDKARTQRQDQTLDMLGGVIPSGALPATSFGSVLKAFDNSSAPIEASLLDSATGFAQDMEQMKADEAAQAKQIQVDNQNYIRELALSVATETGDTKAAKVISSLVEGGDIDAAINASLAAYGEEYYRSGNNIVTRDEDGSEETVLEFKSSGEPLATYGPADKFITMAAKDVKSEAVRLFGTENLDYFDNVQKHTQDELKSFMAFYLEMMKTEKMSIPFTIAYNEWRDARGTPVEKDKKGESVETGDLWDDVYGEKE